MLKNKRLGIGVYKHGLEEWVSSLNKKIEISRMLLYEVSIGGAG